ncbi:MAG: DUF2357 domain-containing protein [Rhodospirillaceae bacterium]|nr:DUF2357 domain-containing protein [Rhodospirillaceae bacterium]
MHYPATARNGRGSALVLNLVNSVGVIDLPHLGNVELESRKFGANEFETMLRELAESATGLPFAAGETASSWYNTEATPHDEVLYHAFVYLRYVLSERAPEGVRLLPALEVILREPHRFWRTYLRDVPTETLTRVDGRTPLDLVTRTGVPVLASSLSRSGASLVRRLGRRLPETMSERRIRTTTDTAENRFVKSFVGQSRVIIGRMRTAVMSRRPNGFRRNVLADCRWMEASLLPIAGHSMWEEVGRMTRIPFSSTVLQRRRGYRQVLQHFTRIRLAPTIPLDEMGMRDLLELKNIAVLYELWTFFRIAQVIAEREGPPHRAGRSTSDDFGVNLPTGVAFEWESGTRLAYNKQFSRTRSAWDHSYSVPLRPDITLRINGGRNSGLHLFDSKFRVRVLADVGLAPADKNDSDEKAKERAGTFRRGDIYKMHAYRDAIPDARSVWILYPGNEFAFFDALGGHASPGRQAFASPEDLPTKLEGVGAIPLSPILNEQTPNRGLPAPERGGYLRTTLD